VIRGLLLVGALAAGGCWSGRYLLEQAGGQLRLLRERQRIDAVLADPALPADKKRRLALAKAARDFGVEVLGLRGGDEYTRYVELDGKALAYNVVAAPKDKLKPHLWRFPIAGAVPYLGFFNEASARREAKKMADQGYDVAVREVAGYSTTGVLADPVYSSMLEGSDARIVEVVLHEMLHGTLYLPGHSGWNESLATFVGVRGAALFFSQLGQAGARAVKRVFAEAEARQRQQARFARFLEPYLKELEEKLGRREEIFSRIQRDFLAVMWKKDRPPPPFATEPLNNAHLVQYATYHRGTADHERVFERVGRDLPLFITVYRRAVDETRDPIGYLKRFATR
jgi:predicted aminopeptidase